MHTLKYVSINEQEGISKQGGWNVLFTKGQLISKAIYGQLISPRKQKDEFVLFAFLLFMANKSNSSFCFLGESTARQSAFRFYLTFSCSLIQILTYDTYLVFSNT